MVDAGSVGEGELQRIAGVKPSSHWINSYRANASNPQQGHQDSPDMILQQILYHDLRDVVREVNPAPPTPNAAFSNTVSCAQRWRQAVQSQQPGSNDLQESPFKATLPDSFRLMVQVEEVVDVSRNAETRYEPGGNPNRCLKLCLSDGYFDDGSPFPPANPNNAALKPMMMAMEVSPIPNLSFSLRAGAKLLLQGPIDIRWGVMVLHEGNTLLLGGEVPHLREIQAKAVDQARKLAGVGIDPTIRALIWNPETGDEQEEDEGEQESGNVPVARAAAPIAPPAPPPPSPNPSLATVRPQDYLRPALQNVRHHPSNLNNNIRPPAQAPRPDPQLPTPNDSAHNHSIRNTHYSRIDPSPPPAASAAAVRPQNPYVRNASTRSGTDQSNSTSQSTGSTASPVGPSLPIHNRSITPRNAAHPIVVDNTPSPDAASETNTTANNSMSHLESRNTGNIENSGSFATANSSNGTTQPNGISSTTRLPPQPISFIELLEILTKARQDEVFYQQQYGKVFEVQMQQIFQQHYFNVEKVKKRKEKTKEKKKGDKAYQYVMHAPFSDPSLAKEAICCAVASDVLEPYFGCSPAEMRQLNKTDKEKSHALTKEGGNRIKETFYKLCIWETTMAKSTVEFFNPTTNDDPSPPPLDGKTPILLLLARRHLSN